MTATPSAPPICSPVASTPEAIPASDAAHRAEDSRAAGLVRALREASPEFSEWWAAHDVAPFTGNRRVVDHPRAGVLAFDYVKLSTMDDTGRKLVACLPADPDTAAKLPSLAA
ncbi:hypothetical protein [Amycolatopsis circi]|uniref:MmyB family transcriptional regulator n=1 Tax=Amycolatopsis circi TaxID=871959 RepID=UPI0013BEA486